MRVIVVVMTERGFRVERDLQDDWKLDGLKLGAGLLSVCALVALFVYSLYRAPEPAWSVVLLVTAVALAVLIVFGVVRGRRNGRFRSAREGLRTGGGCSGGRPGVRVDRRGDRLRPRR